VNYFLLRVELASIEGKVYDLLYSTRSKKVSSAERSLRVQKLSRSLDRWLRKIPPRMQFDVISQSLGLVVVNHMAMMYHVYHMSLILVHGIYSYDADWVRKISSHSKFAITTKSNNTTRSESGPPLPHGWAACVNASRSCMRLFQESDQRDCLVW